ncbi:MAG TPA: carboxymuconolactone decarboxylase family protein [Hyphomonas sp.]|nr:carboxymuconolactone decarboxylase family protein [Hyphomonas sp.]MCB9962648.1 carboxymuconolactone decarboxylase family protein [Hyphomonas sp.]MCB9972907.1 carboxymuconolactone decarboxylase family protein [Hyphomonas sp.]HPE49483.1 carboxymuconolactone decarboxylase family protein [Hyphomonas sp.]
MRLKAPRIAPLADSEITEDQRKLLGDRFTGPVYNIFRTLAKAPKAYKAFMHWGGYVLSDRNSLSARDRELVILRTGFNWKAGYEWAQHERIGLQCGLTPEEIARIKAGPDAPGWSEGDKALLQATDELTSDAFITDATWAALSGLNEKQRMDLVMTVGQYTQVSMMLNSFGIQLDDDLTLDPDLAR